MKVAKQSLYQMVSSEEYASATASNRWREFQPESKRLALGAAEQVVLVVFGKSFIADPNLSVRLQRSI